MNKRRSLSKRLILILAGSACAVMAGATVISSLIFIISDEPTRLGILYLVGMVAVIVALFLFIHLINRIVVWRIRSLSQAVSEVSQGNYDLSVPLKGNDELTELSENFNKMAAELRANAFLSKDFARYVSHEFKTPLAVIRSYAEAVQAGSGDSETKEYMNIIISEADRLTEMAKAIMELCRLDSTTLIEKKDVFSPAAQIRAVLISSQLQWGAKNLNIRLGLEEFTVTGNEKLSFRIWQNLIGNAVKFTDDNGTVGITLRRQGDGLLFTVSDDGVGIAEEDRDKIFDMFFTGDKSRNKEGSGLGLPLTKTIVEKLGGEIAFTSERGRGTVFTVTLP